MLDIRRINSVAVLYLECAPGNVMLRDIIKSWWFSVSSRSQHLQLTVGLGTDLVKRL